MIKKNSGFTLVELMLVVWILATVITGMIQLFIYTSVQAQMAGNKTLAISEAQNKIEAIRNHTYSTIAVDYASGGTPGNIFTPTMPNSKGVIYLDTTGSFSPGSSAEVIGIKVVVYWKDKYNRIVGEDQNFDGVLAVGEDLNGNNQHDSPASLISMITRR